MADHLVFNLPDLKYSPDPRRRYDFARFVGFREGAFDPANSRFLQRLKELPAIGQYTVVNDEGRPDLVSHAIYQDTQFWWILLAYNGLLKSDDLVPGFEVQYFSLTDLNQLYSALTRAQQTRNRATP
jgi:hypothetical protein